MKLHLTGLSGYGASRATEVATEIVSTEGGSDLAQAISL